MTFGCEMNQILLRTLKNHLKNILGEKMQYHRSNDHYDGYQDPYYDSYYDQPWNFE